MKKRICFDLDGVICNNTYGKYEKAIPYHKSISKINELFDESWSEEISVDCPIF